MEESVARIGAVVDAMIAHHMALPLRQIFLLCSQKLHEASGGRTAEKSASHNRRVFWYNTGSIPS